MTVTQTPEVPEIGDPADRRLALGASGLLRTFNEAGVLEAADVHVATRVAVLSSTAGQPPDEAVTLAMALTVRAIRNGSVCLDLTAVEVDSGLPELPWPRLGRVDRRTAGQPTIGRASGASPVWRSVVVPG